jgi:hypothetical protein
METLDRRIENAIPSVRDVAFPEVSFRIPKNPNVAARLRSFAYTIIRASGSDNVRNTRRRAALDLGIILGMPGIAVN